MACALAAGVPARPALDVIDAHGPRVFVKKRQRTLRRAFFGTLYDSDKLAKAIDSTLSRSTACNGNTAAAGLPDSCSGVSTTMRGAESLPDANRLEIQR